MLGPLKSRQKALEFALLSLAVTLGLCRAWAGRHWINPDGISYLDLGDAYIHGTWTATVNGLWNPFYPCFMGLALKVLHPSMAQEFPVVHFLNFLIYLAALASFRFFWTAVICYDHTRQDLGLTTLPAPVWTVLGYTIFIVSTLEFIGLEIVGADLCLATFVFLAAGLVVRLRTKPPPGECTCFWELFSVLRISQRPPHCRYPSRFSSPLVVHVAVREG